VFTGTLKDLSRDDVKNIVERLGARASSSVSKNTDYLVAGESPGSKYEKQKNWELRYLRKKNLLLSLSNELYALSKEEKKSGIFLENKCFYFAVLWFVAYLSTFFCLFCIVATSYSEEVSGNYGAESALDVNIEEESSVTETGKMSRVKIGEELALKGKYEEAMHEFERSIREDPYNANAYLQLGLIYFYVKNDPKKAVELIKQALEIDHTLVDAYYNLGYIYAKAGHMMTPLIFTGKL